MKKIFLGTLLIASIGAYALTADGGGKKKAKKKAKTECKKDNCEPKNCDPSNCDYKVCPKDKQCTKTEESKQS